MIRPPAAPDLAVLCADHLRQEETLLAALLPMVRALKDAFGPDGFAVFAATMQQHHEIFRLIDEMNQRRRSFQESAARHLKIASTAVTLSLALRPLPEAVRQPLSADADRVRRLAGELTVLNNRLSVHVRIFLDAYRRLLRDFTGTSKGSGRYGRAGRAESLDYRPLIQVQG
jgi:hypothetical protein